MSRSSALDDFASLYRAFVVDLIRLTNTSDHAPIPDWALALIDAPFTFPPLLQSDGALVSVQRRLATFALKSQHDTDRIDVARDVIRQLFLRGAPPPAPTSAPASPMASGASGSADVVGRGPKRGQRAMPPNTTADRIVEFAADDAPPPSIVTSQAAPVATSEVRYLNAGIPGHSTDQPLTRDTTYALQFGVDLTEGGDSGTDLSARLLDAGLLFRGDESSIDLTIQLDDADFTTSAPFLTLTLPKTGPSLSKVSVDVTPRHDGRCTLKATVFKQGNYLLQMTLQYSVGATDAQAANVEVHGRSLSAATIIRPREIVLTVDPIDGGYRLTAQMGTRQRATIPIPEAQLNDLIAQTRAALMTVVTYADASNRKPFQEGIDIDAASSAAALKTLAVAGGRLYRTLFYGRSASDELIKLGDWLRAQILKPGVATLQILADTCPIPWGLLYVGDTTEGATLDWELFVGMRHIIELIPIQTNLPVDDFVIASSPVLSVGVTVNTSIDQEMKRDVVAQQLQYWTTLSASGLPGLHVAQRQTRADLLAALRARAPEQLMYFYCHATTKGPADVGGIAASNIELTGNQRLTLDDLDNEAPSRDTLPGQPLVFLNACESAELTASFYDGFVPYFLAKGARGVVGTECKTPAVFATEWAMQFFPRFLAGESLGALFLALRREFCLKRGNPMGLVYAVYCDADTCITPGLSS